MGKYNEIISKTIQSIKTFYEKDSILLNYETQDPTICERTISFRLGIYLQDVFKEYNVDCEYNRNLEWIKKLDGNNIYPDVIIHKRKKDEDNLVWIEIKKYNSAEDLKQSDRERLIEVTKSETSFKYKLGLLIILDRNINDTVVEVYIDGNFKEKYNLGG